MYTTGYFSTPNGSKYLQQLCKHFGHKIEVEFSETEGKCAFIFGPALLAADAEGLTVRFELTDEKHIPAAHHVIDSHLETFAHREGFEHMTWS